MTIGVHGFTARTFLDPFDHRSLVAARLRAEFAVPVTDLRPG